ncbi:hypothetical protein BGZ93_011390 [Podila epicladia]|nr:hypothetical protein BGZ92_001166 [Podila epicladia]KAG0086682.1 hypothetical protein BGZ93_011390 [Podila epicladia]
MKSFTPIFVLAALCLSSTAVADLFPCNHMKSYQFDGADYSPSPMNPGKEVCITIDGKFKIPLPQGGTKIKVEIDAKGDLHGDWYNDLVYSGGQDDRNPIKACFFLSPQFGTITRDSKVSVRLSVPDPDNASLNIMCMKGTMTVG